VNNPVLPSHATVQLPETIAAQSGRGGTRGYKKTGLYAAKAALKEYGNRALDGRTGAAKALAQWRNELVGDLGGPDEVSTQELAIVDAAVKTKLLLDSLDTWLLQQSSLINARRRSVYPVVLQRQQLADALARYMGQLGLKRRPRPAKSLSDLLISETSTERDA
jgi:hypothetical protein